MRDADTDRLLAEQREYYELRAPDFADVTAPPDRRVRGLMDGDVSRSLVDSLSPGGDVLELAGGTGVFTRELARHSSSITVVDGSPRMLERNRVEVGDDSVSYICADIFTWQPTRRYDFVFFGFWLSHVPPSRFDSFWSTVRACVRTDGRVGFVDEDDRARAYENARADEIRATRTLRDGRSFDIVKVFWSPDRLQARLADIGWDADVRAASDANLIGVATPAAG